jgi:hypothetical protein
VAPETNHEAWREWVATDLTAQNLFGTPDLIWFAANAALDTLIDGGDHEQAAAAARAYVASLQRTLTEPHQEKTSSGFFSDFLSGYRDEGSYKSGADPCFVQRMTRGFVAGGFVLDRASFDRAMAAGLAEIHAGADPDSFRVFWETLCGAAPEDLQAQWRAWAESRIEGSEEIRRCAVNAALMCIWFCGESNEVASERALTLVDVCNDGLNVEQAVSASFNLERVNRYIPRYASR